MMLNKDPLRRFPRHTIAAAVSAVCSGAQGAILIAIPIS